MKTGAWQRAIDLDQLTRWMDARELESVGDTLHRSAVSLLARARRLAER